MRGCLCRMELTDDVSQFHGAKRRGTARSPSSTTLATHPIRVELHRAWVNEIVRSSLVRLAILALVLAVVPACGRPASDRGSAAFRCEPGDDQAALIAQRLTSGATEARDGRAIRLDPPVGQYVYVVAARVQGEVGVWAVGPWLGGARIMAVDDVARRWSDWGTAIPDDSPAGSQRSQLASRPEVAAVRVCP